MSDPEQKSSTGPEAQAGFAPAMCSAAALLAKIEKMRKRRRTSSSYYSVHVDELLDLLSMLETIIQIQERQNEKPPNGQAQARRK